jgi:hypothetical protein
VLETFDGIVTGHIGNTVTTTRRQDIRQFSDIQFGENMKNSLSPTWRNIHYGGLQDVRYGVRGYGLDIG